MDKLRKAKRYIINAPLFYFYARKQKTKPVKDKAIYLKLKKNHYKRYLYCFLKFFEFEGYSVYLEKNLELFDELRREKYASFLLSEGIIHFGKPGKDIKAIQIDDTLINPDYFSDITNNATSFNAFYVPMSQHPLMYHAGYWNQPVINLRRKRSVFMVGNFDSNRYDQIDKDGVFELMSRLAVYRYVKEEKLLFQVENKSDLNIFLESSVDNKVILINRLNFDIPMAELRPLLSSFDFFFALPGVVMPFSHNIIEAMSVGTIPVIQQEYAALFKPALTHTNAVIFKDKNDLIPKLNYIYTLSEEKVEQLRNNVYTYYNNYLTPQGMVKPLEKSGYSRIYLQAEHYSVQLFRERLRNSLTVR